MSTRHLWNSPMLLFLRSALWTVLLPGMVAGYIPWRYFGFRIDTQNIGLPQMAGMLMLAIGAAILLRSIVEFARRGRGTLSPLDPPRELVVTGMYRWVRNPMYVGVALVLLGEIVISGARALIAYAAVFVLLVNVFIRVVEEPSLRRSFGASYEAYTRNVRRWIPRTSPWNQLL